MKSKDFECRNNKYLPDILGEFKDRLNDFTTKEKFTNERNGNTTEVL